MKKIVHPSAIGIAILPIFNGFYIQEETIFL